MLGARVVAVAAGSGACIVRGGRRTEEVVADPFMRWVFLLSLGWRECERECGRGERRVGVTVKSEATEVEDGKDVSRDSAWVVRACGRGVRGTTVCVEVVERDDDDEEDDDTEGAGETERGDEEVDPAEGGVGISGGDGGWRAAMVSVCKLCRDEAKFWWKIKLVARLELYYTNGYTFLFSCGNSLSYCKNSFA